MADLLGIKPTKQIKCWIIRHRTNGTYRQKNGGWGPKPRIHTRVSDAKNALRWHNQRAMDPEIEVLECHLEIDGTVQL